ncbi:hypothetical protein VPH35_111552 [Triticum aestivum]
MGTDNSGQINYEELKAVLEQVGARIVCGISSRRVSSEMALLGTAISGVNVLAMPILVPDTIQESNVIRSSLLWKDRRSRDSKEIQVFFSILQQVDYSLCQCIA